MPGTLLEKSPGESMTLYIILEGVLVKTKSKEHIPVSLMDMEIDQEVLRWIGSRSFTEIVILSNQTWIFGTTGSRMEEKFWSKAKYVTECLLEYLEGLGKFPKVQVLYSIRKPWIHGLHLGGPSLIERAWINKPELQGTQGIFYGRPIPFDMDYARRLEIEFYGG